MAISQFGMGNRKIGKKKKKKKKTIKYVLLLPYYVLCFKAMRDHMDVFHLKNIANTMSICGGFGYCLICNTTPPKKKNNNNNNNYKTKENKTTHKPSTKNNKTKENKNKTNFYKQGYPSKPD